MTSITAREALPHMSRRPPGPAPTVDPELIRQVMSRSPRPTAVKAAEILSVELGKPVAAELIRTIIKRRGKDWDLEPTKGGGGKSAMDYACDRAHGLVRPEHRSSHARMMLTAYERIRAGMLDGDTPSGRTALRYVRRRIELGLVVGYHPSSGYYDRIALPWEREAGSYLALDPPEFARLEVECGLEDPTLPGEVRMAWEAWLDLDRAASGDLRARKDN